MVVVDARDSATHIWNRDRCKPRCIRECASWRPGVRTGHSRSQKEGFGSRIHPLTVVKKRLAVVVYLRVDAGLVTEKGMVVVTGFIVVVRNKEVVDFDVEAVVLTVVDTDEGPVEG